MRLIEQMYCVSLIQMEKTIPILISFLHGVGLVSTGTNELDSVVIERDTLIEPQRYEMARNYLPKLRSVFSSSYLTSLQDNASKDQRWPLINLVRQMLKHCGYKLLPKRVCNGYTKSGKKSFRRVFIVHQLTVMKEDAPDLNVVEPESIEP